MEDAWKRLANYLKNFGDATVQEGSFNELGEITDYPTIRLVAREKFAQGLEQHISTRLTKVNGYDAYLRFIAYADNKDGNFVYSAEIVPYDEKASKDAIIEAYRNYLRSLPRTLADFRMKNKNNRSSKN